MVEPRLWSSLGESSIGFVGVREYLSRRRARRLGMGDRVLVDDAGAFIGKRSQ